MHCKLKCHKRNDSSKQGPGVEASPLLLPSGTWLPCVETLQGAEHPKPPLCGHSQTPNPARRAGSESASSGTAPLCQATQALRDAAATKTAGPIPGPSQGRLDPCGPQAYPPGSPTSPVAGPGPAPPHPGRPPAPRLHGNGRAPGAGCRDEESQQLSDSPHRHRGSLRCPAVGRSQCAVQ